MEKDEDIKLLLAEEQTLLSRERTMYSYMQTGLAFTSVGLVVMKFLSGPFLILSCLIEYMNLSDFIPINIGFLRGQRYNENWFPGSFQY